MKESDLRKLYLSVVNLYGFVYSKDLFKILNHYEIPYKMDQILKDLQNRTEKMTRFYYVQKMKSSFLIINPRYSNEEFQMLCSQKQNKPMYFPKTYENLLQYSNYAFKDENEKDGFTNLYTFLKRHTNELEPRLETLVDLILISLKESHGNGIQEVFSLFELFNFELPDEKAMEKFLKILQNVSNNLRMPSNNGFTPNELRKMSGPIDLNNVVLTIGPNMKENFLNGTSDPYDYLKELENSNMPQLMKDSFRNELLEIIKEIEKTPKA